MPSIESGRAAEVPEPRVATLGVLSDTEIRISRIIHAPVEKVWQAHTEPEIMRKWLTGDDGRTMVKCDWKATAGESYRFGWAREDGSQPFEFGGEVREVHAPRRLVTTERMFGDDGPEQVQILELAPHKDGTLLTQVHTFPDRGARDQGLDSRMVEMETTFQRLEKVLG